MSTLSITPTYSDDNNLTASQLAAVFTAVETYFNTTKVDAENIQAGGLRPYNIAEDFITSGEFTLNNSGIGINEIPSSALSDDLFSETMIQANTIPLAALPNMSTTSSSAVGVNEVYQVSAGSGSASIDKSSTGLAMLVVSDSGNSSIIFDNVLSGSDSVSAITDGYCFMTKQPSPQSTASVTFASVAFEYTYSTAYGRVLDIP